MTRAEMIKQLQSSRINLGRRNGKTEFMKLLDKMIYELKKLDQIEHYAWLELDDPDDEDSIDADSIRLHMIRDVLTGEDEE